VVKKKKVLLEIPRGRRYGGITVAEAIAVMVLTRGRLALERFQRSK